MVTLAMALALLAVYQLGLTQIDPPAVAESNSQVVVLRAQQYEFGATPQAVLAGSSISGRLPPAAFTAADFPVANLGLDGLSAAFGMNVILDQETLPATVLVEVNTIAKQVGQNGATVNAVRHGFGYNLSRAYPPLRSESRPTTLIYDTLRKRRNSGYSSVPEEVVITERSAAGPTEETPFQLVAAEQAIQELLDRNVEVILVILPTGSADPELTALASDVSARLGIPVLEISLRGATGDYYTDGVHLTPPAAEAVSAKLGSFLAERERLRP